MDLEPIELRKQNIKGKKKLTEQLDAYHVLHRIADPKQRVRFVDEPVYREGLDFLLASRNEDGAWGDVVRAEQHFGRLGKEAMILHTTLVVIDALTIALHRPWNPRPSGC